MFVNINLNGCKNFTYTIKFFWLSAQFCCAIEPGKFSKIVFPTTELCVEQCSDDLRGSSRNVFEPAGSISGTIFGITSATSVRKRMKVFHYLGGLNCRAFLCKILKKKNAGVQSHLSIRNTSLKYTYVHLNKVA